MRYLLILLGGRLVLLRHLLILLGTRLVLLRRLLILLRDSSAHGLRRLSGTRAVSALWCLLRVI